jgi:hypothetical protein
MGPRQLPPPFSLPILCRHLVMSAASGCVVLGYRLEVGWVLARGRGFGLSLGVLQVCVGVCVFVFVCVVWLCLYCCGFLSRFFLMQ